MNGWMDRFREERRRSLALREIEAAVDEIRGHNLGDPAWRAWYRCIVLRRLTESGVEQEGR
ncbi:MAG: hypothetical protein AABZ47_18275 [Planctomycetota bacterium]